MKIVYTFFLGALLALFVGMGIQTFYPGPDRPDYPVALQTGPRPDGPTAEDQEVERQFFQQLEQWREEQQDYNRDVGVMALVGAVLLLVLSLVLEKRNRVLTNGVMLGGLFTLFYAIGRSFASTETTMTFIAVGVGLVVVLVLGHRRFFQDRPAQNPPGGSSGTGPASAPTTPRELAQ